MEKRINYLLKQFELGVLTEAERVELHQFAVNNDELVANEITKLILLEEEPAIADIDKEKWNVVLNKILAADKPQLPKKNITFSIYKWAAAAVVLLSFSIAVLYYVNRKEDVHVFTADVDPGSNKAILTLADGRKISLTDAINGDVAIQDGISITKTANGQLIYTITGQSNVDLDSTKFNTISTPNGGEWQIRLPDGSNIWLNAASSLKYPLSFASSKQRHVELSGEAYFEVAKDKARPFIVSSSKQKLEVLGTHFNINSYIDEPVTKTTLLEGSIRISQNGTNNVEVLEPGEQSIVSANGINVKESNVEEAVAWRKGYFMFVNEKQESIMRKIARWYNVEVNYADPSAKEVMYYGTVSRFDKISKILRKFEQTGEVRFEINAKKITVYKD